MGELTTWVIYDHPIDYPDNFVVRRWVGLDSGAAWLVADLAAARSLIAEFSPGLVCMDRSPGDDPNIVESWF